MIDSMAEFEDDFTAAELDETLWSPYYLPHWSSRAEAAATYEIRDSAITLSIPPEQGIWCEGDHTPPLRVSGIQSANSSGPVGSTDGPQRYREGLVVREQQEPFWGWTPGGGLIELRAKAELSPRSMMGFWLAGLEDEPERSAEICVAEIFGNAVVPGESADIGMGLRSFRDPAVTGDFEPIRIGIRVEEFHTYGLRWSAETAEILVDGEVVKVCADPPTYPMQLMIAVFDFPEWSNGSDDHLVPTFTIDWVRGSE